MLTEEDFRKYLWPEEKILAVFFSNYLEFSYVPDSPVRKVGRGILVLTSHRVLTLEKFKEFSADAFEEVYSVPINNVSAVLMGIYERELKDGTKALLTLWLPAGLCLCINLPGKDIYKAQHVIATIIASAKTRQVSEDGAMAAIQSYERSKQQIS